MNKKIRLIITIITCIVVLAIGTFIYVLKQGESKEVTREENKDTIEVLKSQEVKVEVAKVEEEKKEEVVTEEEKTSEGSSSAELASNTTYSTQTRRETSTNNSSNTTTTVEEKKEEVSTPSQPPVVEKKEETPVQPPVEKKEQPKKPVENPVPVIVEYRGQKLRTNGCSWDYINNVWHKEVDKYLNDLLKSYRINQKEHPEWFNSDGSPKEETMVDILRQLNAGGINP